jgi:hypothetical protein
VREVSTTCNNLPNLADVLQVFCRITQARTHVPAALCAHTYTHHTYTYAHKQELWSMVASAQEDPSDSGLPRVLLEEKKAEMEARRLAEQDLKVCLCFMSVWNRRRQRWTQDT